MVYAKVLSKEDGLDHVIEIIQEVFVDEYNYNEDIIRDNFKGQVFHAVVYEGIKDTCPIATGRLVVDDKNTAQLQWIAVKKEHRRKQYGDMVVRMLVEKAKLLSCSNIETRIPAYLLEMFREVGFYPMYDIANSSSKGELSKYILMKYDNNHISSCKK